MGDEIILYYDFKKNHVTVKKYNELVKNKNQKVIAEFIYNRLYSRYIKPFEFDNECYKSEYKNGFSMMASFCLLIETFQTFKEGAETSEGQSEKMFKNFFNANDMFSSFRNVENINGKEKNSFYKHVRCGILHQGETTGGWKINRKSDTGLFEGKNINANEFMNELKKSLNNYKEDLLKAEWNSEIWENFRKKMEKIIENTEG